MTSTPIRRAARSYRCRRCGYQAVYQNAGAKEARYWFGRHSCQKQERQMVRAVMAEVRAAAVDRTPQSCLHKQADHQHGTRAAYVLDRCRCNPCSEANSAAENERTRLKAYGRYNKYVNAHPVRLHLAELADYGIGLKRVAALSGIGTGTMSKIFYGVYAPGPGGRNGKGEKIRQPSRRVLRSTAEKIYAIEPVPANLGSGQADHERTPLARTHLQALVALGWSQSKLATRLGMLPTNLGPVIGTSTSGGPRARPGLRVLSRGTVDKIEALFNDLAMTLPPETNQRERIASSRARNYAAARGWLPPLALEDLETEEAVEHLDQVAIERRLAGDKTVRLTRDERAEAYRLWTERGLGTLAELERRTGINASRHKTEAA